MAHGDNCLFHSLAHGVVSNAATLRAEIVRFLSQNASRRVDGLRVVDWIRLYSRCSVEEYASQMEKDGIWGGAIEMMAFSLLKGVEVHVYEPHGDARQATHFKRISVFSVEEPAKIVRPSPTPAPHPSSFRRSGRPSWRVLCAHPGGGAGKV